MISNGPKIKKNLNMSEEELNRIQPETNLSSKEIDQINQEIEAELDAYLEEQNQNKKIEKKGSDIKFYSIVMLLFLLLMIYKLGPMFVELYTDFFR